MGEGKARGVDEHAHALTGPPLMPLPTHAPPPIPCPPPPRRCWMLPQSTPDCKRTWRVAAGCVDLPPRQRQGRDRQPACSDPAPSSCADAPPRPPTTTDPGDRGAAGPPAALTRRGAGTDCEGGAPLSLRPPRPLMYHQDANPAPPRPSAGPSTAHTPPVGCGRAAGRRRRAGPPPLPPPPSLPKTRRGVEDPSPHAPDGLSA